MSKKPELNKEFIIDLQGNKFVKYEGLLDMGHQIGIKDMRTEIIQFPDKENTFMAICQTKIITEDDRVFSDIGDASPSSVNSSVTAHLVRMASTRAKARTLRDLTNIGMTTVEELGGDDKPSSKKQVKNVVDTEYNNLIIEARQIQQELISKDKVQELGHITNGRQLIDIKDKDKLKTAIKKAKQLLS